MQSPPPHNKSKRSIQRKSHALRPSRAIKTKAQPQGKNPPEPKKTAFKFVRKSPAPSISPKISILMTSHQEPHLPHAIDAILSQRINGPYEFIIVSPDEEAQKLALQYQQQGYPILSIKDQGRGKAAAINNALKEMKGNIIVFTDGDVTLLPNAINELIKPFDDPKIGCVSGRVVSANPKDTMFGFWSHVLTDAGAHQIRKEGAEKNKFLECTGYLFACRNKIITKVPLDAAEDTIIPYLFKQKGYDSAYAENAKVLVKNPTTWKDWLKQRVRTAKAHETLSKYVDTRKIPRVKSFSNEVCKGIMWAWSYPHTLKEYIWTLLLFVARFYMWLLVFTETRILKKQYSDKWERIKTAR